LSRKQTNRKLKNYPRIKNYVRRAPKIRRIRTADEFSNCNGVPILWNATFTSNRNVALHARNLGPPGFRRTKC